MLPQELVAAEFEAFPTDCDEHTKRDNEEDFEAARVLHDLEIDKRIVADESGENARTEVDGFIEVRRSLVPVDRDRAR